MLMGNDELGEVGSAFEATRARMRSLREPARARLSQPLFQLSTDVRGRAGGVANGFVYHHIPVRHKTAPTRTQINTFIRPGSSAAKTQEERVREYAVTRV